MSDTRGDFDVYDPAIVDRVLSSDIKREDSVALGIIGHINGFMLRGSEDSPIVLRLRRFDKDNACPKEVEITLGDDLSIQSMKTYYT